jgi:hypothetical protein
MFTMTNLASLRYKLEDGKHEYDFVDGSVLWQSARGIRQVSGDDIDCHSYLDSQDSIEKLSAASIMSAVAVLANYVASKGHSMAFSDFRRELC